MAELLATAKALVVGAFKHPNETTVVVRNKRTGKVTGLKVKSRPAGQEPTRPTNLA